MICVTAFTKAVWVAYKLGLADGREAARADPEEPKWANAHEPIPAQPDDCVTWLGKEFGASRPKIIWIDAAAPVGSPSPTPIPGSPPAR